MDEKQKIRKIILEKRMMMTTIEVSKKSKIIKQKIEEDQTFQTMGNILFYISYGNEVSTHSLIKKALQQKKQVIIPRSNTKTHTIIPIVITTWDELTKGAYGILEPFSDFTDNAKIIDLIILPAIAFDVSGNRLGRGKGYYDRLIQDFPTAMMLGLAYEYQIIDKVPTETHDKKVDKIITEKRIIDCNI